ncbi:MAG: hypothetical protein FWD82_02360, partial [Defluviitaleaceae bacterium]|nr:hypothetical protein [Defluviitaleaceae bacterium]
MKVRRSRIVATILALMMGSEGIGQLSLSANEEANSGSYGVTANAEEYEEDGYEDIVEDLNTESFEITDHFDDFLENTSFNSYNEELEQQLHILANSTSFYSSLREEDRLKMRFELSVREDTMSELETYGLNIRDSIIKAQLMQMFDISVAQVFGLVR